MHSGEDSREVSSEEERQRLAAAAAFYRRKRLVWNCIRVLLVLITAYLLAQHFR
jgi:hypothetical protein